MLKSFLDNFEPRSLFIFSILVLSAFGLVMVFSSSSVSAMENHADAYYFLRKQSIYLVIGLSAFGISSLLNIEKIEKNYKFFYFLGILLLLLILIPGISKTAGGASRWINLGIFSFQPIELSKYFLIIFISKHLIVKKEKLKILKLESYLHLFYQYPMFSCSFISQTLVILFYFYQRFF